MKYRLKTGVGTHRVGEGANAINYQAGDVIASNLFLNDLFKEKFEQVEDSTPVSKRPTQKQKKDYELKKKQDVLKNAAKKRQAINEASIESEEKRLAEEDAANAADAEAVDADADAEAADAKAEVLAGAPAAEIERSAAENAQPAGKTDAELQAEYDAASSASADADAAGDAEIATDDTGMALEGDVTGEFTGAAENGIVVIRTGEKFKAFEDDDKEQKESLLGKAVKIDNFRKKLAEYLG